MEPLPITLALAREAGVPLGAADEERAACLFQHVRPHLTEWSLNAADDPRGALRFGAFTFDGERVAAALAALDQGWLLDLRQRLPVQQQEGVGLAFGRDGRRGFRWWRFARLPDGSELAAAAAQAVPALAPDCAFLSQLCGGAARCVAVGAEAPAGQPGRLTVYFDLLRPALLVPLLERIACPPSEPARAFFHHLLGQRPGHHEPWAKVWIGRSVGPHGGWKFYWFARGNPRRPADGDLLDLVGAGQRTRQVWRVLGAAMVPEAPASGLVQLVGLTFADSAPEAEPRWTLYLAER